MLTGSSLASTPSSGTITTPTDTTPGVKQTITYTGGPIANSLVGDIIVANTATFTCKRVNPPTACDWFDIDVNPPSSLYASNVGLLKIHITWQLATGVGDPAVTDLDLYIVDSNNNNVAESVDTNTPVAGNDKAEETVAMFDPKPGHYRILVVGSTVTAPVNYTATVTYSLVTPPTPPPATSNIFQNFVPPVPTDGSTRMGTGEGEPSIGVNQKTGNAMVQSGLETIRLTFNDSVFPSTATWTDVGSTITSTVSLDPILWTDPRTNRTFVSQLMGGCSLMAYSDDDGANWFQNPIGCGFVTAADHQTVGGGPFQSPLTSTDLVGHYPDNVMYCAQGVVAAECAQSTNGGILFGAGFPTYTVADCGGLHGHVRVGPEGNMYLPNSSCDGGQGVAVSTDGGATWSVHVVPGSTPHTNGGDSDPWVDVAGDGTVYFGYSNGDGHAMVAVSHDAGSSW
ncbi:MAG TPA: sialidase family protein, partial [Terriglobales bacterium]|nr:sialidase family protein [Terriglobales bacterium]